MGELVERLLRLEEVEQSTADLKEWKEKLSQALHALSLFCAAKPTLVLPHLDVIAHFLKHESAPNAIQHVCEMLPRLLRIHDHPPTSLLKTLETYLTALIFRVPEPNLMHAIPALAVTFRASGNAQLAVNVLTKFFAYLKRLDQHLRKNPPAAGQPLQLSGSLQLPSVQRAMLCVGLLCQHYDYDGRAGAVEARDDKTGAIVLVGGEVIDQVHRMLLKLAQPSLPAPVVLYAYKGLGQMIIRRPELLVASHDLIERALGPSAAAPIKRQMLGALRLLLTADEDRHRTVNDKNASGAEKKEAHMSLAAAAETSAAVTGALQSHLPMVLTAMLDPRDAAVRHAALALVGALLKSGLAHPARILPKILALEVDTGVAGAAEAAKVELRGQFERHREMITTSSISLAGALEAYTLHTALREQQGDGAGAAGGAGGADGGRISLIYTLLGTQRKPRHAYLRALLGQLAPEQHEGLTTHDGWAKELRRCEWLCHSLANMPYEKEGDVLEMIYQANRVLSLHADRRLQEAAVLLGDDVDDGRESAAIEVAALNAFAEAEDRAEDLALACHRAALVGLTASLKQFLKRVYGLSASRCGSYDPIESARAPERPTARVSDAVPFDTSAMWAAVAEAPSRKPAASKRAKTAGGASVAPAGSAAANSDANGEGGGSGAELASAQYCWFRSLMAADEDDFDFFQSLLDDKKDKDKDKDGGEPREDGEEGNGADGGGGASSAAAPPTRARGKSPSKRGCSPKKPAAPPAKGKSKAKGKKRRKHDSSDEDDDEDDEDDEDYEDE